jgi:molecular chaperone GrpE
VNDTSDDTPRPHGDEEAYQLDLDEHSGVDVEELTREALAAVAAGDDEPREKGVAPVSEAAAAEPELDVAQLQAEIADLRDRSIRTLADFENYRRRADKEREDLKRFANSEVLRDLLPVVDNLERALSAGGSVEDLKLGVELTLRQFKDVLRQRGVGEVAAVGVPFDPTVHEAVAREEDPAVAAPTVTAELQRGYTLNGRLLRPALVRVAVPAGQ